MAPRKEEDNMSLQIQAQDLLSTNIESLSLEELEEHAQALRQIIMALADGLASPAWSAPVRYNAMHLVKRLALRLDETLSLIDDRRCEQAEQQQATADGRAVALNPPAP